MEREPVRVVVLGSTGSIGVQTLEVIRALNADGQGSAQFQVVGLAARRNAELLERQAHEFGVARCVLTERDGTDALLGLFDDGCKILVSAMVGAAGLVPTLEAWDGAMDVALANKECLVAAGSLFVPGYSRMLPIDSEHSAIWQCLGGRELPMNFSAHRRMILTASGGPFRSLSLDEVEKKSVAEALKHPRWSMGAKITIDSATMVNKAFEMIEARWLFAARSEEIDVLVHPQSVVHSMVEFRDGSVMAQLGDPDMKGPIGYALWMGATGGNSKWSPNTGARRLSFKEAVNLQFEPACEKRWEALGLARWVIDESFNQPHSALGAVFNAANEVAVEAFLQERLAFGRITQVCREAMERMSSASAATLEGVLAVDAEARARAGELIAGRSGL